MVCAEPNVSRVADIAEAKSAKAAGPPRRKRTVSRSGYVSGVHHASWLQSASSSSRSRSNSIGDSAGSSRTAFTTVRRNSWLSSMNSAAHFPFQLKRICPR